MPEFDRSTMEALSRVLQEQYSFVNVSQLDKACNDILRRTATRLGSGNTFSLSRMIRGSLAMQSATLNESSREQDVQYCRALTPSATPGSYLIPTVQADVILEMLYQNSVARAAGARIWPMDGIFNLNVPSALASPTFEWIGVNSQQSASDPNLGQMSFTLKTQRALVAIPNELLRASVPAFDTLLADILSKGAATHEDAAIFGTTTASGAPGALYAAASTTKFLVGSSASGGNLGFSDLLMCLEKASVAHAVGPFAWFCSPRTFFRRILGMLDGSSRPLAVPTAVQGLYPAVQYSLLGWPVFVTSSIQEDLVNSNGSAQSWLAFCNPTSTLHIGQSGGLEVQISREFAFDKNQTCIRMIRQLDTQYAPAAAIQILQGIN